VELIGKANLRTVGLFSNTLKVRLLPSTGVTRLRQYCKPVRHPMRPSLLPTEFSLRATTSHRWGFPCFVVSPSACMPSPLPWWDRGTLAVQSAPRRRPSPNSSWVGSHILPFRGLLSVHSRYGLHARRVAYATLFIEGFSDFVTSIAAPIATGWNDSCRAGIAPAEDARLCTAH
jgi:hypothetical protein